MYDVTIQGWPSDNVVVVRKDDKVVSKFWADSQNDFVDPDGQSVRTPSELASDIEAIKFRLRSGSTLHFSIDIVYDIAVIH